MRLKCIKLAGFKSFVDPTTVHFPSNLSAVVGPNGCGKSNIIDAVRWVMGESSAKNLRGESMTDVIFNGSGGRKPVGQASIELVFDNSDGKLLGEYASFSEISIKRKVTRDAQNFYYLNGTKCRRRDITDIFLGTGLGPRSYAIIEQGMISRLIEAKPEELRVYIEEAAGISKYKERRRDTENRMRRTMENLERLTDIRDELDRQLSRLERQAQAAEKYSLYKKEEREARAQLQALRYKSLDEKAQVIKSQVTELELKVEALVTDQVNRDTNIEKYRTQFTELGDRYNEVQGRYYALGTDVAKIEQTIQHAQERTRQLQMDLEQTDREAKEADAHFQTDSDKAQGWEAELMEIEPELEMVKEAELEAAELLQQAEEAMQVWQTEWDQFNQTASEPRQRAEVEQSKIQHLEQVQSRLLDRIDRLKKEKEGQVAGDVEEEIALLGEQLEELGIEVEEKRLQVESLGDDLNRLSDEREQRASRADELKSQLQTQRGRHASLEALQQAAMAEQDEALGPWLQKQGLQDAQRVAETLEVSAGWDKAVETVLGSSLQAVCANGLDSVSQFLGELEQGELVLLDSQAQVDTTENSRITLPILSGFISSALNLNGFLAGIYAAETLADALQVRSGLKGQESVVTRDGIWLGGNWVRVLKTKNAASGVIARKKELETLSASIAELEEKLAVEADALEALREDLRSHEQRRESLRRESDAASKRYAEVNSEHSAKKVRVEQIIERRERLDKEINEAKEQLAQEAEKLSESRTVLQEAIEHMERDSDQREALLSRRDDIRAKLDQARQTARHSKDRSHELAMRYQSVKTQLDSIKMAIGRLSEQTQRLQDRRQQLLDALGESQDPAEEHKLELEALLEKRLAVENELTSSRAAVDAVEHDLREAEKTRNRIEQEVQGVRGQLENARLQAQTLEVQRQNLREQLEEEQFELETLLETLPEDLQERALEEELEQLAARISRLGAINLAAIDEYKTESERKNYLDSQNADLHEALETLENAIKKIDRETRTRFKETFDQVNTGLQTLFPKVFGGGHAYLELTGEDLLDTGIAIMARPPGKRNSTIHLLSGGEKALTAIALVFSIFQLNPAPFCMLDEVDAPLDDANVGRYARMVEEMSAQVQFIYITHNKIAMEMAHQLLGVTMHEPGVSRLVTVDVEEAAELAAS